MKRNFSTRMIALMAMLMAVSVVLSRLLGFYITESLRVSFEYFPIMLAGVCFGPAAGLLTGAISDFLGAVAFSGLGFNPIMIVGPTLAGLLAGLLSRYVIRTPDRWWKFLIICGIADLLSNFLWGTYALSLLYGAPFLSYLILRAPLKLVIAVIDSQLVFVIHRALRPVLSAYRRNENNQNG